MTEKVIQEFQIVETDDGFRIELKGDKEILRRMLFEGGFPFGMPSRGALRFARHFPFAGPMPPAPPEPPEPGEHHHRRNWYPPFARALREGRKRHFGARWEARWGYDLGPWWDEGDAPDVPDMPDDDEATDV
ncbi:MAG: hypothetical protein IT319_19125 [Anaerolineae bacterium]|nr:hypothetical protein [Anaerolineae bacterium]